MENIFKDEYDNTRWGLVGGLATAGAVVLISAFAALNPVYFVQSGQKALVKRWGVINTTTVNEGLHFRNTLLGESVINIDITPQTMVEKASTYTKDNQPIDITYSVIYTYPQGQLASTYILYGSDPYSYFANTKIVDALKAVGGKYTASEFVTKREVIRREFTELAKLSVINAQDGRTSIQIIDTPIANVDFDNEYEQAIKNKQVAQQNAQKAEYVLQQAKVDAQASIAKAEGEAQALKIKASAINNSPQVIRLNEIDKWDGHFPLGAKVIGGGATIVDAK